MPRFIRSIPGTRVAIGLAALGAAVALAAPTPALACGGFFCSQVLPVDQTGERILFTHDEAQNLVTYVQVRYQGDATSFSWVLPVPGLPTVAVGTDDLFAALEQRTNPQWQVTFHDDSCQMLYYPTANTSEDSGAGGGGGFDKNVNVVSSGQAGPYDYKVLAAANPDDLLQWLSDHSYDVTDEGGKLLRLYVDSSHYFVAVKLIPEASADDIQPIVLRYAEPLPCVPLRLTAVAATDDMGIRSWILSDRRAVPQNYAEVRINEARIDWFSGGSNYQKVVSEAVDAAPGGEGFVTEYAGSTSPMQNALWQEGQYNLDRLRTESDPGVYVQDLINQGFLGNRQMLSILRENLPEPKALLDQGVPEQGFYNCVSCYSGDLQGVTFDPAATTAAIEERIVQPHKDAQALIDAHPYMTALFSTMSPSEMLDDPIFTYNADLPEVSNVHLADAYVDCSGGGNPYQSPVRMVLHGGGSYVVASAQAAQGGLSEAAAGPAARTVLRLSENGPGTVLKDNSAVIESKLAGTSGGCAGCASGGGELTVLGLLAAALLLRRRP